MDNKMGVFCRHLWSEEEKSRDWTFFPYCRIERFRVCERCCARWLPYESEPRIIVADIKELNIYGS
jgi:hypothetical protein